MKVASLKTPSQENKGTNFPLTPELTYHQKFHKGQTPGKLTNCENDFTQLI